MVKAQKGLCYICEGKPRGLWKKLVIDHNHVIGKIRKLLCDRCNMAIGSVEENIDILKK